MTPRRHQRPPTAHRKGWRKPPGAVMIVRPNRWGNPHPIGKPCPVPACHGLTHDRETCLVAFDVDLRAGTLVTRPGSRPLGIQDARRELAGRDVVCACGPDEACHGDILLRYANEDPA